MNADHSASETRLGLDPARVGGSAWFGPLAILVAGLVLAAWSYYATRFSGYWDDTVFLVALARGLEGNFLQVAASLVSAPSDTYCPLLVGLTWLIRETGLMGNGLLNAIAATVLAGLSLVVYACARELRLSPWMSTWAGLATLFTPALVDQRLWFISVQHTLTITLVLLVVLLGTQIARSVIQGRWDRSLLFRIVLLDLTFIAMAFVREVALAASVFFTLALVLFARSWRSTLLVSVGWIIPALALGRALLTGRSGTQVATIGIVQQVVDAIPQGLMRMIDDGFLQLFVSAVLVAAAVQLLILMRARQGQKSSAATPVPEGHLRAHLAVTISAALLVGTTLLVPRTVVLEAAALPGVNILLDYHRTFAGRWAMYAAPIAVVLATFVLLWLLGLLGRGQIPIFATGAALASVAPYLGSSFVDEAVFGGKVLLPTDSLSRYVVYIAPFGVVLAAWLLAELASRWRMTPVKVVSGIILLGVAGASISATIYRSDNVRSLFVVRDSPEIVRIVHSEQLRKYLVGYGNTIPGQVLKDVDAVKDDSVLTSNSVGGELEWVP